MKYIMMSKTNNQFWQSATKNKQSWLMYYNRLTELSVSMFDWQNVPDTIDTRFLELCLFGDGMCVFFKDDVMGYLALRCMIGGRLDVYQIPTERTAYASNGYNMHLDNTNSVIIFNNYLHTPSRLDVEVFAKKLYNLDRAIDVNANAQKTPVLIRCDEKQRLTMKNLYMKYEGNEPFIFADKNLNPKEISVLQTNAPYVAGDLYQLKTQIYNEALTYLGISNVNQTKKERLITDEVSKNNGGTMANRFSRLETRKLAVEKINRMFGLNINVEYRKDFMIDDIDETESGVEE